MSRSPEVSWLSEKRRLARFHLECEQPGFGGVRRRQAVAEGGEQSLDRTPPLHSSTPLAGAAGSKDWRKNFASNKSFASSFQAASDRSENGDWSLGGDSGYGGLDSSRVGGRLPFPKKSSSWWSPLLRRVLGRPSFLEPEMASRWVRLHPQQMIALVLTAALLACVGFSSVLLFRHMPIRRHQTPSRDVIEQETVYLQDMMGEVYDDPFEGMGQIQIEGMEQIFGMEGSENVLDLYQKLGEEIENMGDGDLEDDPTTVELMDKEDVEKKKAELLNKIKSFGLPSPPVDNLLGSAKGRKEEKVSLETPKNTASSPDSEIEASVKDDGGEATVKGLNEIIDSGALTQTADASGEDKKQKSRKTKVVNPLVRRLKKKTSKAKKAQEL